MKFEIRDPDWATELQNSMEEYMMKMYDSLDAETGTPEADPHTESGIPFCGCNICEGREILSFLSPRIIKGYLEGKIGFFDVEEADVVEYLTKED